MGTREEVAGWIALIHSVITLRQSSPRTFKGHGENLFLGLSIQVMVEAMAILVRQRKRC